MYSLAVNSTGITDNRDELLSLVGEAIFRWSVVETQLSHLYRWMTGAHGVLANPFHQSIVNAHHAILSFDGRLAMTSAATLATISAFRDAIPPEARLDSRWADLADRIGRHYTTRNHMAHFSLYGDGKKRKGRQIWICPNLPIYGTRRPTGKKGNATVYFKSDIKSVVDRFQALAREIEAFEHAAAFAMRGVTSSW